MYTYALDIKVVVKMYWDHDAQVYVIGVPALDIYTQGTTIDIAKAALKDAISGFLAVSHDIAMKRKTTKEE